MTPKVKYPIKQHWEPFTKLHSEKTIGWIKTLLGEEISLEAFIIAHKRLNKIPFNRSSKLSKNMFRFLTENNWIKKG